MRCSFLNERTTAAADRLARDDRYAVEQILTDTFCWPGDLPGRYLLTQCRLNYLNEKYRLDRASAIVARLREHLNPWGYFGAEQRDCFDEQQLAGHSWLVAGLLAYADQTGYEAARDQAMRILKALHLPALSHIASYPRRDAAQAHVGEVAGTIATGKGPWRLSSDIYCVLISLQGLASAFADTRDDEVEACLEATLDLMDARDLEGEGAQLHAVLTAAHACVNYHLASGSRRALETAERVFSLYYANARTINDAAFNWFGQPGSWTEPCAMADITMLALGLWRVTGSERYLHAAEGTLFNGLGSAQKLHGGFGCDSCATPSQPVLVNHLAEAWFCCSMRAPLGLIEAALTPAVARGVDVVSFGIYQDASFEIALGGGVLSVSERTGYPFDGTVRVTVDRSTCSSPVRLMFPVPAGATARVSLNGSPVPGDRCEVVRRFQPGDLIELDLDLRLRAVAYETPLVGSSISLMRGPLLLTLEHGRSLAAQENVGSPRDGELLEPLCDLFYRADFAQLSVLTGLDVSRGSD